MNTRQVPFILYAILCLSTSCAEKEQSGYERRAQLPPEFVASSNTHDIPGTDLVIKIPKDWQRIGSSETDFVFADVCGDTLSFCSNLVVDVSEKREYISPEQLIAGARRAVEQELSHWDVEVLSQSLISINSLDGCIVEFQGAVNDVEVAGSTVALLYINKVLSLNFVSSNHHYPGEYQDRRKAFENICKSVYVKEE